MKNRSNDEKSTKTKISPLFFQMMLQLLLWKFVGEVVFIGFIEKGEVRFRHREVRWDDMIAMEVCVNF